ncbi:MAG: SUMF1/EgtB/PvdO family nonheme iron enzyme [Magnetococcus sp. YQC-5]
MNIKRPLFDNRKKFHRTSGATRKPIQEPKREFIRRKVPTLNKKQLAITGGVILGIGMILMLLRSCDTPSTNTLDTRNASQLPWHSCLTQWPDGTLYPDLLPVPTGEYPLSASSQELKSFLAPHGLHKIAIKDPFLIEKNEVTVKAFRRYVDFVQNMPSGAEKERAKSHIGLHWNKEDSDLVSVKGISWEAAWDYTEWLGQKTGCAYALPSREQWGAAVLFLNDPKNSGKNTPLHHESMKQWLWGTREWTSSACTGGYYLVGEDDLVPLPEVRSATCMPAILSVAGFRVVIKAVAPSNQPNSPKQLPAAAKP